MHYVYILYNRSSDKYHIGETENVAERLKIHNSGKFKSASTTYTNDWQVCLIIKIVDRIEARKVEKYIKAMKSKRFVSCLVSNQLYFEKFKTLVFEKFQIKIIDWKSFVSASRSFVDDPAPHHKPRKFFRGFFASSAQHRL